MTFTKLSPKQKRIFKWCYGDSIYNALICDGAVRSGKTICMITSFILWAMKYFNGAIFGICGKTVRSAERNIITPLMGIADITAYFKVGYTCSTNLLTVERDGRKNSFYVFGGKDEGSASLIQGLTLAGAFLDEVALYTDLDESADSDNCVSLMTMHSSKGLEFRIVYILDANEWVTPHHNALLDADIEEERRMFYVAMTRAKKELTICYAGKQASHELAPSRFLQELRGEAAPEGRAGAPAAKAAANRRETGGNRQKTEESLRKAGGNFRNDENRERRNPLAKEMERIHRNRRRGL